MITLPDIFNITEKKPILTLTFKDFFKIVVFEGEKDPTGLECFPITVNGVCSYFYFSEHNWTTKNIKESGLDDFLTEQLKSRKII